MIKEILQGMVVGLANIIPGVSGGTMMVSMGIYDKLIHSITHLFSNWKKSIGFLLPIFAGAGIALVLLAKLFEYLLETWPVPTNLGFCGLIVGSLPFIYAKVKGKKTTGIDWTCFGVFFLLVAGLALVGEASGRAVHVTLSLGSLILLFLVGVVAAATMVIPGVSGSMILMLLGYYEPILQLINNCVSGLVHLDFAKLFGSALPLIPFGLGVVVGIFVIAKAIEWVMARYEKATYWAIIGLIAASPIAILVGTDWSGVTLVQVLVGIVTFGAGWFAAGRLGEK